jgi:hypothetical protein
MKTTILTFKNQESFTEACDTLFGFEATPAVVSQIAEKTLRVDSEFLPDVVAELASEELFTFDLPDKPAAFTVLEQET